MTLYVIIGTVAVSLVAVLLLAMLRFKQDGKEIGALEAQKSEAESVIAAVQEKAKTDDDVAKLSPDARRSELSQWVRE